MSSITGTTPDATTTSKGKIQLAGDLSGTAAAPTIGAGKVTNAMLSTSAGEIGAAWQDWTPTLTGMTLGNGAVVAKYIQVGKTVHFHFSFTMGSTSAMSSGIFTAPVTAATQYGNKFYHIGQVYLNDASSTDYPGFCRLDSTTAIRPLHGTTTTAVSSTAPFTWVSTDYMTCTGTYEAA